MQNTKKKIKKRRVVKIQINDLEFTLSSDEIEELKEYQYDNDLHLDNAAERVKEINTEIGRFTDLFNQKKEQLENDYQFRIEKLKKKKQWDEWNLINAVKNSPNKKETKTQWKLPLISADIIVKKENQKMIKPKVDENTISQNFTDYKKEKTVIELDWAGLKKDCEIRNGKVVNIETGEDLSEYIAIETEPEKVEVK